jgi:hypothetical protein
MPGSGGGGGRLLPPPPAPPPLRLLLVEEERGRLLPPPPPLAVELLRLRLAGLAGALLSLWLLPPSSWCVGMGVVVVGS